MRVRLFSKFVPAACVGAMTMAAPMKTRISKRIMKRLAMLLLPLLSVGALTLAAQADKLAAEPNATLLVTDLEELQGSAVGPGGALFVTAPLEGSIYRVDPKTGAVRLFASGLPARNPDFFFIGSGVVESRQEIVFEYAQL